jgi:hypothetical protein
VHTTTAGVYEPQNGNPLSSVSKLYKSPSSNIGDVLNKSVHSLDKRKKIAQPNGIKLVKNKRYSLFGNRNGGDSREKKSPTVVTNTQSITNSVFSNVMRNDKSLNLKRKSISGGKS